MEKFVIEEIQISDIREVACYLAAKSGGIRDEKDFEMILQTIWVTNPYIQPGKVYGWKITDTQKKIRGVLGNIPVQCMVYGELKDSFWATSWFVDEEARNQSLQMFMLYVKQQGLLMSNTPNENVEKLLAKLLKYKRADSPWFKGSYLLPVKPAKNFFSAGDKYGFSFRKFGVFISGICLKFPQTVYFYWKRSGNLFNEVSVKQVYDFSESTDNWFNDFAKHHACTLVRSARMYKWLFADPVFRVFEVKYENRIQGYMVCKLKQNKDFSYIELIDEAILPMPERIQQAIVERACYAIIKSADNESILVMRSNSETARRALRKMPAVPVKKVEKSYYKEHFLKNGESPFLTSLDGDSIFY